MGNSDMTIKLAISHNFTNKQPKGGNNRFYGYGWQNVNWTLAQIADHISAGKAISVAELKNDHRDETEFVSSQIIGVDIDRNIALNELLSNPFVRLYAFKLYPSPSSTRHHPRNRILFALDKPYRQLEDYKESVAVVQSYLTTLGIPADPSCKGGVQIFFGSTVPGAQFFPEKFLPVAVVDNLLTPYRAFIPQPTTNGAQQQVPPTTNNGQQPNQAAPLSQSKNNGKRSKSHRQRHSQPQRRRTGHDNLSKATRDFLQWGAPQGQRNDHLFKAACDMAGNGISEQDAIRELAGAAKRNGLSDSEIRETIRSAYKKPRNPSRKA